MEKLVRGQVKGMKAYHVDEPDVLVKLHANESPYNLSEKAREAIAKEIRNLAFNRYPDPSCLELRSALGEKLGVNPDQVALGNGSDELIQMIMMVFGGHSSPVLFPTPTFSMYKNIALSAGEDVRPVPLDDSFDLDLQIMAGEVRKGPSVTFISYPNNPTGNCFSADFIEKIIMASEGIVVVDEAYYDYSKKTFIDKLKDYPNLIVLRTLSKVGLASLRLGMLVASKEVAELINRVRLPYNITSMSQVAGLMSLEFAEEIEDGIKSVIDERAKVYEGLENISFTTPFRTDSNFILFRAENSRKVFDGLISKGVLIRNLHSGGPLKNCLRVTVGRPEENDAFLRGLKTL